MLHQRLLLRREFLIGERLEAVAAQFQIASGSLGHNEAAEQHKEWEAHDILFNPTADASSTTPPSQAQARGRDG